MRHLHRLLPALFALPFVFDCSGDDGPADTSSTAQSVLALPATPVIAQGITVDSLPGSGKVTSAGQYEYRVPLEVPHGRAGMEPHLELLYSSSGGDGPLGTGWVLNGLAAIKPCAFTRATEHVARGINLNNLASDLNAHCLDGRKLVAVPGQGTMPTEFRTEEDTFAQVIASYSGGAIASYRVRDKNGRVRDFSSSINGLTLPDTFLITTETDRFGNQMTYDYYTPSATEYYPGAIWYASSGALSASRAVLFNYTSGGTTPYRWVSGQNFPINNHLTSITMYAPNPTATQAVWTYGLYYATSATGRMLLSGIDRSGQFGGRTLRKTFQWESTIGPAYVDRGVIPFQPSWHSQDNDVFSDAYSTLIFDANDDGRDDILFQDYVSTPTTTTLSFTAVGEPDPTAFHVMPLTQLNRFKLNVETRVGDYDGDGHLDLATFVTGLNDGTLFSNFDGTQDQYDQLSFTGVQQLRVWTWTGSDYQISPVLGQYPLVKQPSGAFADFLNHLVSTDLDGDGLLDLVVGTYDGASSQTSNVPWIWSSQWNAELNQHTAPGSLAFGPPLPIASTILYAPGGESQYFPALNPLNVQDGTLSTFYTQKLGGNRSALYFAAELNEDLALDLYWPGELDPGRHEINSYVGVASDHDGTGVTKLDLYGMASSKQTRLMVGDLNGDGSEETIFINPDPNDASHMKICADWGSGANRFGGCTGLVMTIPALAGWPDEYHSVVYDSDGDGRAEAYLVHNNPTTGYDGTAYKLWLDLSGHLQFHLMNTTGGAAAPEVVPGALGDFDGDGLTDVLSPIVGDPKHYHMLTSSTTTHDRIVGVKDGTQAHANEAVVYGQQWWADATTIPQQQSVIDAYTPFGMTYLWAPASALTGFAAPSRPQCFYPNYCPRRGMPVVKEHDSWTDEAIGKYVHEYFAYSNPRFALNGRGFLGFATVDKWNPDVPTETLSFFGQPIADNWDQATRTGGAYLDPGKPYRVWELTPIVQEDYTGSQTLPTWITTTRVHYWDAGYTYQPHNNGTTYTYELGRSTSHEFEVAMRIDPTNWPHVYTGDGKLPALPAAGTEDIEHDVTNKFDDWGNLVDATDFNPKGDTKRTVTKMVALNLSDWLVGLPEQIQQWQYPSGGPIPAPKVTTFEYQPTTLFVTHLGMNESASDASQASSLDVTPTAEGLIATEVATDKTGQQPRKEAFRHDDPEHMYMTAKTNPAGQTESFATYPAFGVVLARSDVNGHVSTMEVDEFGRARLITPAVGASQIIGYVPRVVGGSDDGMFQTEGSADGSARQIARDHDGRVMSESHVGFDGTWKSVAHAYDRLGRALTVTRPGATTAFAEQTFRDSLGRVFQTWPDGRETSTAFTGLFKRTIQDPDAHQKVQQSDAEGRTVAIQENSPTNQKLTTTFTYGAWGKQTFITDTKGNKTSLSYDDLGRRTTSVDLDAGTGIYHYDGFGEVIEQSIGGAITDFTIDPLGRITRSHSTNDGDTTFTWDTGPNGVGKLASSASSINGSVVHNYFYGTTSLLEGEQWVSSMAGSATIRYAYDSFGRLSKLTYPSVPGHAAFSVQPTYTPSGYEASLTRVCSPACTPYWTITAEDAEDRITAAKIGAVAATRTYDPLRGDLTRLLDAGINDYTYPFREGNGDILQRVEAVRSRTETLGYDNLERLTSYTLGTTHETYSYDDLGNLTQAVRPGSTTNYAYLSTPHRLTSATGGEPATFVYDGGMVGGHGRVTDDGTRTYAYTDFDLPKTLTHPRGRPYLDTVTTTFQYDASGKRVYRQDPSYSQFGVGDLFERRADASSTTYVYYIPGPFGIAAQVSIDPVTQVETLRYLHHDEKGAVTATSTSTGALDWFYYYTPFGRRATIDGLPLDGSGYPQSIGFDEMGMDDDLGLIDQRGRIYNPRTRHFLTPDPHVTDPYRGQSYNPYSFARNNPMNLVDPTGYDVDSDTYDEDDVEWIVFKDDPLVLNPPAAPVVEMPTDNLSDFQNSNVPTIDADPDYGSTDVKFQDRYSTAAGGGTDPYQYAHDDYKLDNLDETAAAKERAELLEKYPDLGVGERNNEMIMGPAQLLLLAIGGPSEIIEAAEGDTALAYYLREVQSLDVATARNGAVFYSGPGNRALAEEFAIDNGKTTLEMTPGGEWLDKQQLFDQATSGLTAEQASQVWSALSRRFAAEASGNAVGFVDGARANGVFNTVESPALQTNPNVTSVLTGGH